MNAPTPKPSGDDLESRVTVLEKKVDVQQHEFASLRQYIDNSIVQSELRLRNEIQAAVHASEQRLADLIANRSEALQKRQEEQFRWLFGMLIVIFLSNSAMIVTLISLLMKR
jgi:hypothetical protein